MKPLGLLTLLLLFLAAPLAGCDSGGGDSDVAGFSSLVTVAYEGRLENGTVFDSSPSATFQLSGTIPGFRNNVAGMRVGESKTFTIPPEDAYGANPPPNSGIPRDAALIFDVTLIAVR